MTDRQVPQETTAGSVRLVGTAHISADSVTEVEETIERERPDVVAVELDEGRYRQLKGELPDDLDAGDLLRGNTVFQFLAYWMLSYVQTRLGERFDIEPGADMRAAVETAESLGLGVALVDREIQTTIQRFWARMTLLEKLKLVGSLFLGMFGFGAGEEEELDMAELTDADVVTAMMAEFRRFSPGGAEALIDERDAYIAHKLLALREGGHDVIAVVGAGHREGIERYLADPASLPPMASLVGKQTGRRFSIYKAVGYLIAIAFLAFFFLLVMAGAQSDFLLRVFAAWFLFNGVFAFSLAKLAGAHWPSATVGGAIAWMTSINPLLAPGWFAGYVELRYQRVNVADIGTLNEILADEESPITDLFGRLLDVPLFRLIAVVAATNIGSIIATLLFPLVVLPWLAADVGGVGAIADLMVEGARNSAELVWRAVS
ncbi:TraB/GumN family protein [Halalkalicoccus jeotgali]|uniref:TraB family protein n=1 Tax=Halalkalicoccus jeotgali (strain DSM 18796 / CECT 7217 / JCM 14584 / KCTC 4019 / B3) TaxID=795797 RepID=D8J4R9_HALJB|nr:TraB/GumN family protein [Halalkalicoccus jeotgali]ADJ15536.1 TraB family protein [Halalkalicoccus jeotgali B3]ELY36055.1 TraB family protein [Halalkalicoccus jeotgali B3]